MVDVRQPRVVALRAVHLEVQHPGGVRVLEELRAAGHVPERVGALDGRADDVEVARALLAEVAGIELLGLEGHQRTTAVRRAAASSTALMIDS